MSYDITKYRDKELGKVEDDTLVGLREDIIGELTAGTNGAIDDKLNLLLEIERELTLREER